MPTKKPAEDQIEVTEQRVEDAPVVEVPASKFHPALDAGPDVAPITRGELRLILDDLLSKLGR